MTDEPESPQPPADPSAGRRRFRDEASELLHRVTRLVGEHGDYLSEAAPKLDKLGRDVIKLSARVDDLAAALGEDDDDDDSPEDAALAAHGLPRKPRGPICWPVLGPDEAGVMWELLATWLGEVVIPWMQPTRAQLPDCWPVHPEAVTALTWAWETYRAAYTGPAHAAARAEWATRWWPGALEVVRRSIDPAKCPPGFHLMTKQDRDDDREERRGAPADPHAATSEDKARARRARILARYGTGAARSRVLDGGGQEGAIFNLGNPDVLMTRPSTPQIWLWLYLEAAAEDLAARRVGMHRTTGVNYALPEHSVADG